MEVLTVFASLHEISLQVSPTVLRGWSREKLDVSLVEPAALLITQQTGYSDGSFKTPVIHLKYLSLTALMNCFSGMRALNHFCFPEKHFAFH